ncbi:replication initiator protein [Microviridae sp.]|nr:replication initiator protein [Microviridae sp.]
MSTRCTSPIKGYRSRDGKITQNPKNSLLRQQVTVSCGQCMGCRVKRSLSWAIRCVNELQLHEEACYVTFTYAPEYLPDDGSINVKHLQKFWKRLRKNLGIKFRYFACGEYGEKSGRPHYHALIFGWRPDDMEYYSSFKGNKYYMSKVLNKNWKFGNCIIGNATFQSAAYIARYVTKKRFGDDKEDHYSRMSNNVCSETGEVIPLTPEFVCMSTSPGLGRDWLEMYWSDVFPADNLIHEGREYQVPKYYLDVLKERDPVMYTDLIDARKKRANDNELVQMSEFDQYMRFVAIEKCNQAKLDLYVREPLKSDL